MSAGQLFPSGARTRAEESRGTARVFRLCQITPPAASLEGRVQGVCRTAAQHFALEPVVTWTGTTEATVELSEKVSDSLHRINVQSTLTGLVGLGDTLSSRVNWETHVSVPSHNPVRCGKPQRIPEPTQEHFGIFSRIL